MIELGKLLRTLDDAAWRLIQRAMAEDATLNDIGAAAGAVRIAGATRRKYGAASPASEHVEAEYCACLSARLMEIDIGDNLDDARIAATIIAWKP